jgi:hypothetical protein
MNFSQRPQSQDHNSLSPNARFERDELMARWRKILINHSKADLYSPAFMELIHDFPMACLFLRVGPAKTQVHIAGSGMSQTFSQASGSKCLSELFRKIKGETIMELVEAAFILPANLSIPVVSDGNPWRKPLHGEIAVLPFPESNGQAAFALAHLSLNSKRSIKGLSFEMSKLHSFQIDQDGPVATKNVAANLPRSTSPRLVFSNVQADRKRTVSE